MKEWELSNGSKITFGKDIENDSLEGLNINSILVDDDQEDDITSGLENDDKDNNLPEDGVDPGDYEGINEDDEELEDSPDNKDNDDDLPDILPEEE